MKAPSTAEQKQIDDAKQLLGSMSGLIAITMLAPIAGLPFAGRHVPFSLILGIVVFSVTVPTVLISRGMLCLLLPELAVTRPYAIRLGALVVAVLLAVTPFSLKSALLNRELHPWWLLLWCLGTVVLTTYSWLLLARWRRTRSAT